MSDPDGALYDLLQARFGLGSWDEASGEPWYKARGKEIAKIRASRTKHGVSTDDLMLAADYCASQGIHITNIVALYRHIPSAIKWGRERALAAEMSVLRRDLDEAIAYEHSLSDGSDWLERLLRVQGSANVEEVLKEWRSARTQ